jgi:hypothetical protein
LAAAGDTQTLPSSELSEPLRGSDDRDTSGRAVISGRR